MRSINFKSVFIAMFALVWAGTVQAQYDDLYYNPDDDHTYNYSSNSNSSSDNYNYDDEDYDYDNYGYDDNNYDYDDYDYQYSSRIRRFHRPYYGFNFFDPCYVDVAYYDPFFSPVGTTVLIYDDFYSFNSFNRFRRWNRWNRWNSWGGGFNTWGVSVGWGNPWFNNGWGPGWNRWNRWNSWSRWNDPWFNNGFSNFYCPPSWGNNFNYNTVVNVNNSNDRYYGPRRSGSTKAPRSGVIRTQTPKDVTNTPREHSSRCAC